MQPARFTLMAQILTTPWWLQLIRGLLALAFGFYAVSQPALTLVVMVQFMGAFLFVEGVVLFFFALTNRTGHTKKSFVILRGLLYVLAGVAVLAMPVLATVVTAAMLGWFVGFLAIFGGVMEISSGLRAEKDHPSDWSMVLLGVLSLVFGILLLSAPMAYGVGLSFLFGVWSVVSGVFLVGNSLRIYTGKKRLDHLAHKAV
jgi:uncharacterized membrane protein HdeD (DUF308 family)